jgi:outer membrane protein OmpA-like peptidoglycan-associated protein
MRFGGLLLSIFILNAALTPVFGQQKDAEKIERLFDEAQTEYAARHSDRSFALLREILVLDSANAAAYSFLGDRLFTEHRFQEARDAYLAAYNFCWDGETRFGYLLARCYVFCGQPYKALTIIKSHRAGKYEARWQALKKQAEFVAKAYVEQIAGQPYRLSSKINTGFPELFPSVTIDSAALYFTRRENMDEQLYRAVMEDTCEEWKSVENLMLPDDFRGDASAQFISADGHYKFFSICDNRSPNGWEGGGCDLYMTYTKRTDSPIWTQPQPFGATINSPYYEGMPTLSADNRLLVFASDRPGGYGGLDIWISRFENGLWQLPANAGPEINTAGNDLAPFLDADNTTLYFSSDGHTGMGGYDLFIAKKVNDTTWGDVKNLGYPINTAYDELSECVSMDGNRLIFASDRGGPAGNFDLYSVELPWNLKPIPVCYVNGFVYDSLNGNRLNFAQIFIFNARNGDTIAQFQSNRGDGSFMITLPIGETYARQTYRLGYTEVNDTFEIDKHMLKLPRIADRQMKKNICMLPADYVPYTPPIDTPVVILDSTVATIHFDLNRVELSDAEEKRLNAAVTPWATDSTVIFYVDSYTDNTGTPIINEEISTKRANFIAKYVISFGANPASVVARGWGEAKMLTLNDTEEERKINRRVEVTVKRKPKSSP